jgi:hypothetical protein
LHCQRAQRVPGRLGRAAGPWSRTGTSGQCGVAHRLFDTLTGIQCGKMEDPLGWTVPVSP